MLSPYIKPQAINGGMISSSRITKTLYGTTDALDKRNSDSSWYVKTTKVVDAAKDVAQTIANASGIRSPYFVIGEVLENDREKSIWSEYSRGAVGVVRAVSDMWYSKTKQEGVIIDCLGDVSANISVEFTSKPIFYQTSTAIDSRIRKPTVINATIAVSNYLSDDAIGAALTQAANWDATGAAELLRDNLLYEGYTRAQYALYQLQWLLENAIPFTVYTPHGYYKNMLIQSLKPRTTESSLDMLLCDIVYQEAILTAPYLSEAELATRNPTRYSIKPTGSLANKISNLI